MATGNFCFENRCVVVTNDDYEMDNTQKLFECVDNNRNYPSWLIKEFEYWEVVLTSGYYEGACIDYIKHHKRSPYDVVQGYIGYPSTKKELFKECKEAFGLSRRKMQAICGNVGDMDIDDYVEKASEKVGEYLAKKEEKEVNEYIDKLKEEYGYEEVCRVATFSNGETICRKVG